MASVWVTHWGADTCPAGHQTWGEGRISYCIPRNMGVNGSTVSPNTAHWLLAVKWGGGGSWPHSHILPPAFLCGVCT